MNCVQAKSISLVLFLNKLGYTPARVTNSGTFYISMLKPSLERNPSFQVSPDGHAFHDWSMNMSGTIIDFTMAFLKSNNVSEALSFISKIMISSSIWNASTRKQSFSSYQHIKPALISANEISSMALLNYAESRGISEEVLRMFCKEVRFASGNGKEYYAIGWQNQSRGWELRNSFIKSSLSPKDITYINENTDCEILIFEGFFDFLSAVELGMFDVREMNAVVLNSTKQLEKAFPVLDSLNPKRLICYLDNDISGKDATKAILQCYSIAKDGSDYFKPANDLNEFYVSMKKKQ